MGWYRYPQLKIDDAANNADFGQYVKVKGVCFDCRKVFKTGGGHRQWSTNQCSECGKDLVITGKHWRFPRRHDLKGWKKLQERYEAFCERNPDRDHSHWIPVAQRTSPWPVAAGNRNKPHLRP